MNSNADYYFIRPNGDTAHNDPAKPDAFVAGEQPTFPATYFNQADYCLENSIARIGWPDTGDLRRVPQKLGALARAYDFRSVPEHVQKYLTRFRDIVPGSVVLMPDPDSGTAGTLYIGTVTSPYDYMPALPYECAHRVGVRWDRDARGWAAYLAADLGIGIQGGWWLWAFHHLDGPQWESLRGQIARARRERTGNGG
jgi:hypothetical protein